MGKSDPGANLAAPVGGRVPTGPQAAALHSQVAAVMRVLHSARDAGAGHPMLGRTRLLDTYAPALLTAMLALGEVLAGFLAESDHPADLARLRSEFLEPILAPSRSLPVYQRAEEWQRHKDKAGELHELLLEGRSVGFDAETLLLDHFYKNTAYAHSLRARVPALARLIQDEAASQAAAGRGNPRVLVLGANSVLNLAELFRGKNPKGQWSVLIVDGDTRALRLARQRIEEVFEIRPGVLLAKPESLGSLDNRIFHSFDIVFTLMQYDMHSPDTARDFTRAICDLLKPGGALIAGCYLPSVSRSYHALAVAFADLEWRYWDEAKWRAFLAPLPFDLAESRFETVEPATLAVLARAARREEST